MYEVKFMALVVLPNFMNRPENYDKCDNYKEEYLNHRDIINKCTIVLFGL